MRFGKPILLKQLKNYLKKQREYASIQRVNTKTESLDSSILFPHNTVHPKKAKPIIDRISSVFNTSTKKVVIQCPFFQSGPQFIVK